MAAHGLQVAAEELLAWERSEKDRKDAARRAKVGWGERDGLEGVAERIERESSKGLGDELRGQGRLGFGGAFGDLSNMWGWKWEVWEDS